MEDIQYLKSAYEAMLANDSIGYWLNDTHWVDHCLTDLYSSPPKKRKRDDLRVHSTGCARTEGFYKMEAREKAKYKYHHTRSHTTTTSPNFIVTKAQGKFLAIFYIIKTYFMLLLTNQKVGYGEYLY